MRRGKTFAALVTATVVAGTLAVTPEADAIPVFARKYRTSCATCHVGYPKLNAFGEAYRNNGYRMPGGDEAYEVDEPVSMGAEPWKRLWPKAIWPGDIPYLPPVSFLVDSEYVVEPEAEVSNDFRFPNNTALLTGGTFGDSLSFFGRINLTAPGEDVHVHRLFGQVDRLFDSPMLNVRFGQMEPRAVPFSSSRRLTRVDYAFNTQSFALSELLEVVEAVMAGHGHDEEAEEAAGLRGLRSAGDVAAPDGDVAEADGGHLHGGDFAMGTTQQGVEFWGVAPGFGGRGGFEYGFGVVNGNGSGNFAENGANDNNSGKDIYWRLAYKIGGMSLLGDAETAPAQTDNWRDDSLQLGFFGYRGTAPFEVPHPHEEEPEEPDEDGEDAAALLKSEGDEDADGEGDEEETFLDRLNRELEFLGISGHDTEEAFTRLGFDFDLWFRNLNVYGAYMWGETRLEPLVLPEAENDFRAWFIEGDYVFYPWLIGALRYESVDLPTGFHGETRRWVPHVTALVRANVKWTVDAELYPDSEFRDRYLTQISFAF